MSYEQLMIVKLVKHWLVENGYDGEIRTWSRGLTLPNFLAINFSDDEAAVRLKYEMVDAIAAFHINSPINYWYAAGTLNISDPDFFKKLRGFMPAGLLN